MAQIMAQTLIPIRFRFLKLPVSWEVLVGERLDKFRAAQLKTYAAKRGKELTLNEQTALERRAPAGSLLCGRIKEVRSLDAEVLSELNGWHWRDEFFALPENDLDQLAAFLNEVGAWPSSGNSTDTPGHAMKYPVFVQPNDVWAFRENLNYALLNRNRKWFKETVAPVLSKPKTWLDLYPPQPANDFQLRFELSDVAAGVVTLTNARHMLFATALADVARGIRFKTCQRRDCQKPFAITSEHTRKFCSQYCGHLVSLRKKREKEQRERLAAQRKHANKMVRTASAVGSPSSD